MTDLVVVGGGVGGGLAALAARDANPSASVRLLAPNPGRCAAESGLVDLLGYLPGGDQPVDDPLAAIDDLPSTHPYAHVGAETIRDALALFEDTVADSGRVSFVGDPEQNGLVPTPTGGLRPTASYPESVASGLLSDDRPVHLIGFEQLTHVDAGYVADRLDERLPYEVRATTVPFPVEPDSYPPVREFARALDENASLSSYDTEAGVEDSSLPLREALANQIRPELDIEPRLGFPAVLGIEEAPAVHAALESFLQADVFEVPFGRPSLPGIRLRDTLYDALESSGVTVDADVTIEDVTTRAGRIESLSLSESTDVAGDAFVLATGDFVAGGLESSHAAVTEAVFDCHVPHPEAKSEWSDTEFLGDHSFAQFGVDVDQRFQPLGPDGDVSYENLWAAGTVIGGWDFTAELARSGVELVTGYATGQRAVEK